MKHNEYFDGRVQSLSLETEDGRATVGVITPGKFGFTTATEERMVITSGVLKAKLPQQDWAPFKAGQEFIVKEKLSFEVEADKDVSYICYYK
jgi:purine/pyrimidine-nucleoside phosphorylase